MTEHEIVPVALTPEQVERLHWSARHYIANARRHRDGLVKVG